MRVDLFDFELPRERIALRPIEPRDSARMLIVPALGDFEDRTIRDLPDILRPGDAIVVNDTRVIPARLFGTRERRGSVVKVEIMLHRQLSSSAWRAFARPGKRLTVGDTVLFEPKVKSLNGSSEMLTCTILEKQPSGEVTVEFNSNGALLQRDIGQFGHIPLPPYITSRRSDDANDADDYQTIFAANPGAVAAPTAGLHFTPELVRRLESRGVSLHKVTLHVGAGTFLPVKVDDTSSHKMHSEQGELTETVATELNLRRRSGGRIVAIGTTTLRILESASNPSGELSPFSGETDIFIVPGYRVCAVDVLLTNFHLPRSTLFMLVSAFSGLERMQLAYKYAIDSQYRFYSYGDACLLFRAK
jgi:S-adenosylmethionine:tRNA ribosyltransferase-isomerase